MRKFAGLLLLLIVGSATAQTADYPKNEFFGGYSFVKTEKEVTGFEDSTLLSGERPKNRLQGFEVSYARYLTDRFALKADVSTNFSRRQGAYNRGIIVCITAPCPTVIEERVERTFINALGGPQYSFRNSSRVTPYLHGLAGVAHVREKFRYRLGVQTGSNPINYVSSSEFKGYSTAFALGLGGGLDVRVNDRFSVRAVQADYNPTFFRNDSFSRNNLRLSVGVVIH